MLMDLRCRLPRYFKIVQTIPLFCRIAGGIRKIRLFQYNWLCGLGDLAPRRRDDRNFPDLMQDGKAIHQLAEYGVLVIKE